jgi:hypothetical protein
VPNIIVVLRVLLAVILAKTIQTIDPLIVAFLHDSRHLVIVVLLVVALLAEGRLWGRLGIQ